MCKEQLYVDERKGTGMVEVKLSTRAEKEIEGEQAQGRETGERWDRGQSIGHRVVCDFVTGLRMIVSCGCSPRTFVH